MHFFSVVVACLLCSPFTAAGPLRRDGPRKFEYRQAGTFLNTTSSASLLPTTIEVIPITLSTTDSDTATAITSLSSQISTVSTTSTTLPSKSTNSEASTSALDSLTDTGSVGQGTSTLPTPTVLTNGISSSQTAKGIFPTTNRATAKFGTGTAPPYPSYTPNGSAFRGTGGLSSTILVSANSTRPTTGLSPSADTSVVPEPTTNSPVFPFVTLTTTPAEASTITASPFTPSELVTPTTLSTHTRSFVAITVSGQGTVVTVTPLFITPSTSPSSTQQLPTITTDPAIIPVPTVLTSVPTPSSISASTYAANLASAERYNDIFISLTPTSSCATNSIACISGSRATCSDGRYVLEDCGRGKACFALPMKGAEGVFVGCADISQAERILGLPDSQSVTIGTVPVVVPTTTATGGSQDTVLVEPSVTDVVGTSTAAATVAAVQTTASAIPEAGTGEETGDDETTVLHSTIVSTITVSFATIAPSTTRGILTVATVEGGGGSKITVVPIAASAGDSDDGGDDDGDSSASVVTVTVTEKVTIKEAGVTATVTVTTR